MTELDDLAVGVGRVGNTGLGPNVISSYSTQSLIRWDEFSVRLSSV